MDKGFERCCDLIARMIEKYGEKVTSRCLERKVGFVGIWGSRN